MRILLDTNILLDVAANRNDNHSNANSVFLSCLEKKAEGFITSHSICDFFYITRKDFSSETRKDWLLLIVESLTIIEETKELFQRSLASKYFKDLEDEMQIQCAEQNKLDYIITENLKDFRHSEVPAISSAEFVKRFVAYSREEK